MDTHSREADARMELLMAAAYRAGCAPDTLGKILDCLVTEEALAYIAQDGCLSATMELLMKKILFYLKKRVKEELRVECILYANGYGELARRCGRTSGTNPRGRRTFAVTQFKEETVWYILSGRVREQRI